MSFFVALTNLLRQKSVEFTALLHNAEEKQNQAINELEKLPPADKTKAQESGNDSEEDDEIEPTPPALLQPIPLETVECYVCGDEIKLYDEAKPDTAPYREYYQCPKDTKKSHVQCANCFGQYVQHCADYYVQDKLPVCCQVPECRELVSDSEIRRLLHYEINKHIEPGYERACILSGILDHSKENTPITCAKCHEYTAMFPKNFKERAARLKLLMYKEKAEQENIERSNVIKEIIQSTIQLNEEKKEREEKQSGQSAPLIAAATNTNNNNVLFDLHNINNSNLSMESIGLALPAMKRQQSEGVLTSLFFDCQKPSCGGVTCLRCEKAVHRDETEAHVCSTSRIEELFNELIGVLADGSVMKCPKTDCNSIGQKDENCCHMTCPECSTRWCYGQCKYRNVLRRWAYLLFSID
jgi:hypothetical protein